MTTIQNTDDLLAFLTTQMENNNKQWYGFSQQKLLNIKLVHEIAARNADLLEPSEVVDYVLQLNDEIYNKIVNPKR